MFDILVELPLEFWCVGLFLIFGFILCTSKIIGRSIGIPMVMVLATVTVWYVLDVIYNDYAGTYAQMFPPDVLIEAWWQVIVFLLTFLLLTPFLHSRMNARYLARGSQSMMKFKAGIDSLGFQRDLGRILRTVMMIWFILVVGAVLRYRGDILYFFFPYLGQHPGPWLTSGVGGGINSLLAVATNLHMLVGAIFGVIAALSTNKRVRGLAFLGILLSWPLFIFDRTRGYILVILVPAVLAWVFLRLRGRLLKKLSVLVVLYLFVNAWFGFIIATRAQEGIARAFTEGNFSFTEASREHHQGLNMFEELSWILMLKEDGIFNPNIGENYFANLVNPIPRTFWPSKPTIGLDYAIVRGLGDAPSGVGVYATLSQGVIGQGVVNFGAYYGAAFAAFLMSIWACWLARLDLMADKPEYLALYGLGLITTFTLGRDIAMLNLYPFLFGHVIISFLNKRKIKIAW